jgi:hypothetical protein
MNTPVYSVGKTEHDAKFRSQCDLCGTIGALKQDPANLCSSCGCGCANCGPKGGGTVTNCDECDGPICVRCWGNISGMKVCKSPECIAKVRASERASIEAAANQASREHWAGRPRR